MDQALAREEVIESLWREYSKSIEFKSGMVAAIPAHHPIVERRETNGLKDIYVKFIRSLEGRRNIKEELRSRSITDWLNEWKEMHKLLFDHVLIDRGDWRRTNVRFGDPGDEELFKIPPHQQVVPQISYLASELLSAIQASLGDEQERYRLLARLHFEFVRIHPFFDGNGRIARAVVDQVAMSFGFPPAMGGFPRHTPDRRAAYHKAIRGCIGDRECASLAGWIKSYVDNRVKGIA